MNVPTRKTISATDEKQQTSLELGQFTRRFRNIRRILLGPFCHVLYLSQLVSSYSSMLAAGLLDDLTSTLGHGDTLEFHRFVQLTRLDHLDLRYEGRDQVQPSSARPCQ